MSSVLEDRIIEARARIGGPCWLYINVFHPGEKEPEPVRKQGTVIGFSYVESLAQVLVGGYLKYVERRYLTYRVELELPTNETKEVTLHEEKISFSEEDAIIEKERLCS